MRQYVAQRYPNHYAIPDENLQRDQIFWLLTDSRRTPSGTYSPLVRQYVAQRYPNHYAIPDENLQRDQIFWLLTDSRRTPSGTYERLGLPCFK